MGDKVTEYKGITLKPVLSERLSKKGHFQPDRFVDFTKSVQDFIDWLHVFLPGDENSAVRQKLYNLAVFEATGGVYRSYRSVAADVFPAMLPDETFGPGCVALVRRGADGRVAIPGGFFEPNRHVLGLSHAAAEELYEETGAKPENVLAMTHMGPITAYMRDPRFPVTSWLVASVVDGSSGLYGHSMQDGKPETEVFVVQLLDDKGRVNLGLPRPGIEHAGWKFNRDKNQWEETTFRHNGFLADHWQAIVMGMIKTFNTYKGGVGVSHPAAIHEMIVALSASTDRRYFCLPEADDHTDPQKRQLGSGETIYWTDNVANVHETVHALLGPDFADSFVVGAFGKASGSFLPLFFTVSQAVDVLLVDGNEILLTSSPNKQLCLFGSWVLEGTPEHGHEVYADAARYILATKSGTHGNLINWVTTAGPQDLDGSPADPRQTRITYLAVATVNKSQQSKGVNGSIMLTWNEKFLLPDDTPTLDYDHELLVERFVAYLNMITKLLGLSGEDYTVEELLNVWSAYISPFGM